MPYTTQQKIEALRREINLRMRVYPKRVAMEHMTEEMAVYQIGVMKAILDDYEAQYTESQIDLFGSQGE